MQRRLRELVGLQCREFQNFIPVAGGGKPTDVHYGDRAGVGVATTFARADHRHGFPPAGARITIPDQGAVHVWRWRTPKNVAGDREIILSTVAVAAPDGPGDYTAFEGARTSGANQAYAVFAQPAGGGAYNSGQSNHDPQRLVRFDARFRVFDTANTDGSGVLPAYKEYLVGGIKANAPSANFGPHLVDQGIYFRLRLGFASPQVTPWELVATKDGQETVIPSIGSIIQTGLVTERMSNTLALTPVGVPVRYRNPYQTYTIVFDGEVADFFIDGISIGSVPSGFPTEKVSGWGVWFKPLNSNLLSTPDHLQLESLQFEGLR